MMKKPLLFLSVLFFILCFLLNATAATVTLNVYYENVIRQQAEKGLIETWATNEKINLINLMVDVGAQLEDAELFILRNNNISIEEKERVANALIEGYYGPGRGGAITILDIMGKEKGDYANWSIEDKAQLTLLQQKHEEPLLGSLYPVHLFPDAAQGDITEGEALRIAYDALAERFGVAHTTLDDMQLRVNFLLSEDMEYRLPGESTNRLGTLRLWMIYFVAEGSSTETYLVELRNDGTVISIWPSEADRF